MLPNPIRGFPLRLPALLAGALALSLLFTTPAAADLYRWVDEGGVAHYTNDLESIPPGYRPGAEVIELSRPAAGTAADAAAGPRQAAQPAPTTGSEPASEGPSATDALRRLPLWTVRSASGQISLPESLEKAEEAARPIFRMVLVFVGAVSVGGILWLLIGRLRRVDSATLAGIGQGLSAVKGIIFALSIFAGMGGAWFIWHAAHVDWQAQMNQLWGSTVGAFLSETGQASVDGKLMIPLSSGAVSIEGPRELMREYRKVESGYEQAMVKAESDVRYVEELCVERKGPADPKEAFSRLMNMKSGLERAQVVEKDVGRFRAYAERMGLALGEDPRIGNQARLAKLQGRLQRAQAECAKLAREGNDLRKSLGG